MPQTLQTLLNILGRKNIYMTLANEDKCATENLGKEYNFKFP